ncbi:MAG: FAD-dependent oxidoreductase, partial [Patescibacteria group bacterium]
RADPITVDAVSEHPDFKIINNAIVKKVKGDKFVNSLIYTNSKLNTDIELIVSGIFVEIGSIPTTYFVKDLVKLTQFNQIIVDPKNQKASIDGIWSAGDCTDGLYHQNNIAAGDAVKALEHIYLYLKAR